MAGCFASLSMTKSNCPATELGRTPFRFPSGFLLDFSAVFVTIHATWHDFESPCRQSRGLRTGSLLKTRCYTKTIVAAVIFAAVCGLAARFGNAGGTQSQAPWYSIIPPALAIITAFLTHHVIASLGLAIVVGALLGSVPAAPADIGAWLGGLNAVAVHVKSTVSDGTNLLILSFIPPIFTMVETIMASGGFRGIVAWLLKRVRNAKSAQLATAFLGVACFIDDYANAIIVGSMMQPITDRFRVSRAKLAFLVDATSAPISGLAVISTWIAYEVALFASVSQQLGMGKTGYAMFFDALSFRFYCLLMLAFMFAHILLGRDFGPMRKAEEQARNGNSVPHDRDPKTAATLGLPGKAVNALLPLGGLVTFHLTGLWIDGGGPAKLAGAGSLLSPTYWREVISAAEHSHLMLVSAALFGTALAILCGQLSGSLQLALVPGCIYRGIKRALLPSAVLILAWSLKSCCDDLGTGRFLTGLLADRIPPHWFPPLVFVVASIVSFATGTSWGTMAILIPTAIPIAFALDGNTYGLTTMISLGAVLDGAIFGDHCSPISDTTILSSTATSCDLVQHVRTQLPYSLFVGTIALLCAYIPSALHLGPLWVLGFSIFVMLTILVGLGRQKSATSPRDAIDEFVTHSRPQSPIVSENHSGLFSGRMGRWEYFTVIVVENVFFYLLLQNRGLILIPMWLLLGLPLLLYALGCRVRRLHDLDRSGWDTLLLLVPLFGVFFSLLLLCKRGVQGPNRYGPEPGRRDSEDAFTGQPRTQNMDSGIC